MDYFHRWLINSTIKKEFFLRAGLIKIDLWGKWQILKIKVCQKLNI